MSKASVPAIAFLFFAMAAAVATAQQPGRSLDALVFPRSSRIAHYSSLDSLGRNDDFRRVAPGQTITLVDHTGAGIVRRWWITIAPRNSVALQRQVIVRCYWDDETTPSVEEIGRASCRERV